MRLGLHIPPYHGESGKCLFGLELKKIMHSWPGFNYSEILSQLKLVLRTTRAANTGFCIPSILLRAVVVVAALFVTCGQA